MGVIPPWRLFTPQSVEDKRLEMPLLSMTSRGSVKVEKQMPQVSTSLAGREKLLECAVSIVHYNHLIMPRNSLLFELIKHFISDQHIRTV